MTILFSTTAAEAVVINFELRLGSLERLLLAPISLPSVLLGKVLGGVIFGLMMKVIVVAGSVVLLELHPNLIYLISIIIPSLLVFLSLGALLCVLVKEVFEAQTLLNLPRFLMMFLSVLSTLPHLCLQYCNISLIRCPLLILLMDWYSFTVGSSTMVFTDALVLMGFFLLFISPAVKLLYKKFE